MSDYQLLIKIAGQLDGSLSSSVKEAQSLLGTLDKKGVGSTLLKGVGDATKMLVKANTVSLAAIGAGAAKVVKDAFTNGMKLENAMTDLAGTAGIEIGSDAYNAYQAAAKEVGRTTNKTSTEAAEALKYMALAGWDTERSIESLDGMVKLSSATGLDLARTSDLVTDSMGALGLKADDYSRYLDLVATADSAANYTGEQYMETMIRSGGAARNLGIGLEELSAAAGVLANNGTKGTAAGTALNRMFRNMRTDTATKAFDELGMSMYDTEGNFKGLETVLGDLNAALDGKTPEQVASYMDSIFGAFASQGRYLLEAQKSGELAELTAEYAADAVAGNLEARYQTMVDNLKGDLDLLSSAYAAFGEDLFLAMNQGESGIRGIVSSMTDYVNQIHDAFNDEGLLGIADTLGDIFGDVADKINTAGPEAVNAAFDFVDQLYQSIGEQSNAESIGQAAANVVTTFGERFITNTGEFAIAAGNLLDSFVKSLGSDDVNAGQRIADALSQAVSNIGNWFDESGADLGAAAGQLLSQFATAIGENADQLVSGGVKIVAGLIKGLAQAVPYLISAAPGLVLNLASAIVDNIPLLMQAGVELGMALLEGIKNGVADIGSFIIDTITGFDDLSVDVVPELDYDNIGPSITSAIQDMVNNPYNGGSVFGQLDSDAQTYFASLANGETTVSELNAAIQEMDPASIDFAAANAGLAAFVETVNAMHEAGVDAADIEQEVAAATEEVGTAASDSASQVEQAHEHLGQVLSDLPGVGENIDEIAAECEAAGEALESTDEAMAELYDTMSSMGDIGDDVLTSLLSADDMEAKASEITAAMETVSSGVTSAISNMQSGVAESMASLAESLSSAAEAFDSLVSAAESAASGVAAAMQTAATEAAAAMTSITGAGGGTIDAPTMSGDPTAGLDTSSKEITVTMDASQVTAAVAEIQTAMTTLGESATTASATFTAGMQVVGNGAQNANAVASAAIITMVSIMVSQFAVAVASAQSAASGIYSAFASIDLAGVASNMMAGLTAGIEAGGAAAVAAAQNVASQVAAAMSSALQISSPSKVTTEIGYYTGMGLPVGMESSLPEVLATTKSFSGAVADTMDNSLSAPVAAIASGKGSRSERPTEAPGMGQTTFAPVINITVNGGATEETAQNIAALTMEQFRRFYEQMIRQDRRAAFA